MKVRAAVLGDVEEISAFLEELTTLGKRNIPSDPEFVRTHYVTHVDSIKCSVAVDDDETLLGLQILKIASEGNDYDVTPGWGIIGTHVKPSAARRGVGKALFVSTQNAAVGAGLKRIDATIGADNVAGRAYYESIGFRTYKTDGGRDCKVFKVSD